MEITGSSSKPHIDIKEGNGLVRSGFRTPQQRIVDKGLIQVIKGWGSP